MGVRVGVSECKREGVIVRYVGYFVSVGHRVGVKRECEVRRGRKGV